MLETVVPGGNVEPSRRSPRHTPELLSAVEDLAAMAEERGLTLANELLAQLLVDLAQAH